MAHPVHQAPAANADDSILDLLSRFFPGTGEISAFVAGLFIGAGILGVLTAVAFLIHGQIGIWPTF